LDNLPAGVSLLHEDGTWYCECAFLDYLSTGETPAEAIRNFRLGLQLTILANLESSGRFAPRARASYDLEFALKEAAA
jgi:predicted RNase H-like HicB family nuclease